MTGELVCAVCGGKTFSDRVVIWDTWLRAGLGSSDSEPVRCPRQLGDFCQ